MRFTFMKNNKRTIKRVNCSLQDGASAGMRSPQTSAVIKLPNAVEWTLERGQKRLCESIKFHGIKLQNFFKKLDIQPNISWRLFKI